MGEDFERSEFKRQQLMRNPFEETLTQRRVVTLLIQLQLPIRSIDPFPKPVSFDASLDLIERRGGGGGREGVAINDYAIFSNPGEWRSISEQARSSFSSVQVLQGSRKAQIGQCTTT